MRCGADANNIVLALVADAGTAVPARTHALLVRQAVDAPHSKVVEDDGILADWRAVESASAEARLLETERVPELVVVDWLLLQKVGGRLEDDEHQLVVFETLHDESDKKVSARVGELDGASGVQRVGCAVDGFLVASVVRDAEHRIAGAVGGEYHDVRRKFRECSVGSIYEELTVVHRDVRIAVFVHVDGDYAAADVLGEPVERSRELS